ncbi:MAG: DNA-formamidopyrimidine glycosylase family protein, partial [Planctomycetota bacterium]
MPELPDVVVYVERLETLLRGRTLRAVRLPSPFVLRSVEPPIERLEGATVIGIRRLGKRVVIEF